MTAIVKADVMEQVIAGGDLGNLTVEQRTAYYLRVCESLGLNPATQPFQYIKLNGKLVLYARRDATEQLRKRDEVSVRITGREVQNGVYVVTAQARTSSGREDESIGAVPIEGLKGELLANAMMKAETKAKRRVTLAICGLGFLDESEVTPGETVTSDGEIVAPGRLPAASIPEAVVNEAERSNRIAKFEEALAAISDQAKLDKAAQQIAGLEPWLKAALIPAFTEAQKRVQQNGTV
jgi:hypothetical protein